MSRVALWQRLHQPSGPPANLTSSTRPRIFPSTLITIHKMAETTTTVLGANGQYLFTCISCSIAYSSADDQREISACRLTPFAHITLCAFTGAHYRSDHHRYNMKRRVAGLPPVSATVFDQKVLERRAETAIQASLKGSTCTVCK